MKKVITFKYVLSPLFFCSLFWRLKWSKYIRSISTRDTGIISRGSNRFRRGNFETVRRQGGTRNGGVDKCQGNGRGFAKTLIEKRFPSTVRKSNITRATSDSSPLPSVRWSFFNPSYRVKLFKSPFPLNCRGIFRFDRSKFFLKLFDLFESSVGPRFSAWKQTKFLFIYSFTSFSLSLHLRDGLYLHFIIQYN